MANKKNPENKAKTVDCFSVDGNFAERNNI